MIKIKITAYLESIEENILKNTLKNTLKREIDEVRSK